MYVRKFAFFVLLLLFSFSSLRADDEDGGTASPFALGAGGRSIAAGGAGVAVWGESYSMLWNPAGLYYVERNEINLFHTALFDGSTTYSSILMTHPFLDFGVVSIGAIQLRIGGIERRDSENRIYGSELKNVQTRYLLGYARNVAWGFSAGLNLKLDRYAQGSYVANGFGIDAGLGLRTSVPSPIVDGMAIGLSIANIVEPSIRLVDEEVGDPRGIRTGLSVWRTISRKMKDRLLLAIDVDRTRYSETRLHAGGEYSMRDIFSIRGGWDAGIPTFGCGFSIHSFLFDYAYRSTELGGNHLFSLTYRLGASRSERLVVRQREREEGIRRELELQIDQFEESYVKTFLDKGEVCLKKGDYVDAIDHFQKVLLWSPENEQAKQSALIARSSLLVLRGDTLMNEGKLTEALFSYREAYDNLQSPTIQRRISNCEKKVREVSGKKKLEESILSRSIELYTDRKWIEAGRGFEQVLELNPDHELARDYLRKTQSRIKDSYERIIAQAGRYVSEKRYGSALQVLRLGLERFPGDNTLTEKIGEIRELQREAAAGRPVVTQKQERVASISQRESKELRSVYERGVHFFRKGNFARAIVEWERVWRRYPQMEKVSEYLVKAYQYRGMELYAHHLYEEALEVWRKILYVDPDNEKALRYINKTKEELSRLEGLAGGR